MVRPGRLPLTAGDADEKEALLMSNGASSAPAPTRSVEQIEEDIARTREELSETLGVLADKVNPRLQAARAAESARLKAVTVSERAKVIARSAAESAKGLVGDVSQGKPKAITTVAVVAGVAAGVIALAARHRS
jgi:hypothetical protein